MTPMGLFLNSAPLRTLGRIPGEGFSVQAVYVIFPGPCYRTPCTLGYSDFKTFYNFEYVSYSFGSEKEFLVYFIF
jgi:hypothetical protein